MASETVRLEGHIIDSLTLSKVLDIIVRDGGKYRISRFTIGATRDDLSSAEVLVTADTGAELEIILHQIMPHGAARPTSEIVTRTVETRGVLPEGFYATTNLETAVRVGSEWIPVDPIEMDCAVIIEGNGSKARAVPMHTVVPGDEVVIGDTGVRVSPLDHQDPADAFAFMGSGVSSERPKEMIVAAIAREIRSTRLEGKKVLFVGGPAILHTGAGSCLEELIRDGWVNVLFAGNALATHDIERQLFGTSLGVDTSTGSPIEHGHEHHLRAINAVRGLGSIARAVETGLLRGGIMHACITTSTPFVLAGSIRDDGPLPDVITDSIEAQDAMRRQVHGVGVALMVATTLHAVATGNLLPASVKTLCVDSDADTVIKLMDRGTHQAFGLVTDCEFFLKELSRQLARDPA